jgi:hypothetical protein
MTESLTTSCGLSQMFRATPRPSRDKASHLGVLRARDARGARRARNALRGAAPPQPEINEVGPTRRPGWLSRSSGNCQLDLERTGADGHTIKATKLSAREFCCRPTQSRLKAT